MPYQFIKDISIFKQELLYYTHPDVQATAHQVGTPSKDSWTKIFCEKELIPPTQSIDRYIELERTLSSLYCFYLTLNDDYYHFTEAQRNTPNEIISEVHFKKLYPKRLEIRCSA